MYLLAGLKITLTLSLFRGYFERFFTYVESYMAYLCRRTPDKKVLITGTLLIAAGAGMKMDITWGIADISQCILAFINIPVCIIIGFRAYSALDDHIRQRKAGKDPVFKAANCHIPEKTDFWN